MKKLLSAMFFVAIAATSMAQVSSAKVQQKKKHVNLVESNATTQADNNYTKYTDAQKKKMLAESQAGKKIMSPQEKLKREEKEASDNK